MQIREKLYRIVEPIGKEYYTIYDAIMLLASL